MPQTLTSGPEELTPVAPEEQPLLAGPEEQPLLTGPEDQPLLAGPEQFLNVGQREFLIITEEEMSTRLGRQDVSAVGHEKQMSAVDQDPSTSASEENFLTFSSSLTKMFSLCFIRHNIIIATLADTT